MRTAAVGWVVNYRIVYAKKAQKDAKKISRSNLKENSLELIDLLQEDPVKKPPEYEALVGDLSGPYSRQVDIQHRLVYQVYEEQKVVKILRMWTHYGDVPIGNHWAAGEELL